MYIYGPFEGGKKSHTHYNTHTVNTQLCLAPHATHSVFFAIFFSVFYPPEAVQTRRKKNCESLFFFSRLFGHALQNSGEDNKHEPRWGKTTVKKKRQGSVGGRKKKHSESTQRHYTKKQLYHPNVAVSQLFFCFSWCPQKCITWTFTHTKHNVF